MAVVRLSLGNIARNGNRRTTDLIGEAVNLSLREGVGNLVDFRHQLHGFLPHDEIFEMLRHDFWVLSTGYFLPRMSYVHYVTVLHDVILAFQS